MTETLQLLGGMSLEDESGPATGQVAQRRRLALLAILGASRSSVSRDRLLALLWPELDAESARHRLSDSIYVIRHALGKAAVVTAGDDVRLDAIQVRVDVRDFERALDAGALEEAVGLYTGAFLDGFHLSDAAEFERWVDDERTRLAGRFAHALRALASAAERQNDFGTAAEWLRRLAALDPLGARVALRLMADLERAGDGVAALCHARAHQATRQAELGLGEDPEIRAAADALAARLEVAAATTIGRPDATSETLAPDAASIDDRASVSPQTLPRRRRFGARHVVGVGVLAIATLALAGRWATSAHSRTMQPAAAGGPTIVAVFPFVVRGEGGGQAQGDAIAVLLATKLDGGTAWRSVDPNALFAQYRPALEHADPADAARLARRFGAEYFVLGDIVVVAGKLNLGAALYDARTGGPVISRVSAQGAWWDCFDLVDSLAARVLVRRRDEPLPQLVRLRSVTTSSLPALKDYLDGEAQLRGGRYTEAAERFRRAISADSTFALAYYRLAWAYGWNRAGEKALALRMAARYGARLPERARLTVNAMLARDSGDVSEADRLLRIVVARYPDDFDANYELGELLFHFSPGRGVSAAQAREPLERATVLDPSRTAEPLFHLIEIASASGRFREVDSLALRFVALHPTGELAISMPSILALVRHDSAAIERAARDLARLSTESALRATAIAISIAGDATAGARLLARLEDPSRSRQDRARVVISLARLAGGRGEWGVADSLFARARVLDPDSAIDARARLLSLPIGEPPRGSLQSAWAAITSEPDASQPRRRLLAGLLAVRLGDVSAAKATVNDLSGLPPDDWANRALWSELAARCFLNERRLQEALGVLEGTGAPGPPLRFLRGEVLESLGRYEEAGPWYEVAAQDEGAELYQAVMAKARVRLSAGRR